MSKRTVFTAIVPVPAGISREIVLAFLHSPEEMVRTSPLVVSHKPIRAPANCPADERDCTWFQLRGKGWHLPGSNKMTGDSSYTVALQSTPIGCTVHLYAPMNIDIRSTWMLGGRLPGEYDRRSDGYSAPEGAPASGLYLREDVEIRCHSLMTGYVKKHIKKSHNSIGDRLQQRARRHSSKPFLGSSTNGPVDMPHFGSEPSPVNYNYKMEMYQPMLSFGQKPQDSNQAQLRPEARSAAPSPDRTPVRTFTTETMESYTSSVVSPVSESEGVRESIIISALSPPPPRTPRSEGACQFPQLDVTLDTPSPVMSPASSSHHRSISAPSLNKDYVRPPSFSTARAAKSNIPKALDLKAKDLEQAEPEQKQTPLFSNNLYLPATRQRSRSHGQGQPSSLMPAPERRPSRPVSTPFISSNQPWIADDPLDFFGADSAFGRRSPKPYLAPLIIPRNPKSPPPVLVGQTKPAAVEPRFVAGLRLQQKLAQVGPQGNAGFAERGAQMRFAQKGPAAGPAVPSRRPAIARHSRGPSRETAVDYSKRPQAKEHTLPPPNSLRQGGIQREFSFDTTPDEAVAPKNERLWLRRPESPDSTTPTLRNSLSTTASSQLPEAGDRPLEQQLTQYAVTHRLPFHSPTDVEDTELEPSPGAVAAIAAVREMEAKENALQAYPYPRPLRIEKWVASISQAEAPGAQQKRASQLRPAVSIVHKYPNAHRQNYSDLAAANPFADE
ncbi:hypothetical protein CFO_g4001 [Ceratocystis platani]|uniref:DUF7053 domain-containing protein n=1 Tax=Ceratocystis fimbriata f. sp. platani TaxID=88771 RepID=A0A0F8CSE3_CERFI|nr:hypothetical protein CFO_g4001 [Ceratocystis platani]